MKIRNAWRGVIARMAVSVMLTAPFPFLAAAWEKPAYLKAATYVSDAWVVNFWNTESDHMQEEMAQIAADGFNGIILVVPWREFQPQTSPIAYNPYAFEKFFEVMRAAESQGLWVQLRVGYTWDYYNLEGGCVRFRELVEEEGKRQAWLDYMRTIYQKASAYPNFYGGFITWEDFWNFVEDAPSYGIGRRSVEEARKIGFQDYLKMNYSLEEINRAFSPAVPFDSYEHIYIPERSTLGYKMFYEFYDQLLSGLLRDAQKVFPDLSMEVRLDVDPVDGGNGGSVGVPHFSTFPCGGSSYTSLMYSVAMGQRFDVRISAAGALDMMARKLEETFHYNGGKPIFVDQLLYMDNTEGFEHNARLKPGERVPFLTALPCVLRGHTNGYGIWTYRNYTNNVLYNCQFALGDQGWETRRAEVVERGGSRQMRLEDGGQASQYFGGRLAEGTAHENHVRFTAESDSPVTVVVKLGLDSRRVQVDGQGQYDLAFSPAHPTSVSFMAEDGRAYIDDVDVYDFIQDGQLYDIDGRELSCIGAMRGLNAQMN